MFSKFFKEKIKETKITSRKQGNLVGNSSTCPLILLFFQLSGLEKPGEKDIKLSREEEKGKTHGKTQLSFDEFPSLLD